MKFSNFSSNPRPFPEAKLNTLLKAATHIASKESTTLYAIMLQRGTKKRDYEALFVISRRSLKNDGGDLGTFYIGC